MPENSFAFSGIILIAFGAVLAYLRTVPQVLWGFFKTRFTITLDVTEKDVFYEWLNKWFAAQPSFSKKCRKVYVSVQRKNKSEIVETAEERSVRREPWEVDIIPSDGEHFFVYKGCRVWMNKTREKVKMSGVFLGFFESSKLTFLTRDLSVVKAFIQEVKQFNVPDTDTRLAIYMNHYAAWRLFSLVRPRSKDTVVLDGNLLTRVVEDIEKFFSSKFWYDEHSIPYRRGYLLHGSPGNGKSSTVMALASHFNRDVYVLRVGKDLTDGNFMDLLLDLPEKAFLLIEDVEQVFEDSSDDQVITRSGFLNALDGISAATGRVVFMTTNFVDKLDEALLRPGRVDSNLLIGSPTERQAKTYLRRFFDDSESAQIVSDNGHISMAELQAEVIARCTH